MTMPEYYDSYPDSTAERGLMYYLIFPFDAWSKHDSDPEYDVFAQQKQHELFPILFFLIPGVVLVGAFSLGLGFLGNVFFYALESVALGIASMFYLKPAPSKWLIGLMVNLWFSMMLLALIFGIGYVVVDMFLPD